MYKKKNHFNLWTKLQIIVYYQQLNLNSLKILMSNVEETIWLTMFDIAYT